MKRWRPSVRGCRATTRFLGYGHRVSFGYVTRRGAALRFPGQAGGGAGGGRCGGLEPTGLPVAACHLCAGGRRAHGRGVCRIAGGGIGKARGQRTARRTARGSGGGHRRPARLLRSARGPCPGDTRHWCSPDSTAWTVIYESDPQFQVSCLNRFVYVKAGAGLKNAAGELWTSIRGRVSTVGLAAPAEQAPELAPATGPLGRVAHLPAGPDAESAADLAARRPPRARRTGDLDGLGTMKSEALGSGLWALGRKLVTIMHE